MSQRINRTIEIDLPLMNSFAQRFDRIVRAYVVPDIAPHLAGVLTVAVHQNPWFGGWSASDLETGQQVGALYASAAEAIQGVREFLQRYQVEDILRAYRKAPTWTRKA